MTQKILIIDDDSQIHTMIKAQFESQRFEFISAKQRAAGLAAAAEHQPEIILLDVDLQEMQGFEVCRRLKSDRTTRSIPVIFITGAASLESKIFGLDCGGSDYLTKPFNISELQARVRAALRTKSQLDRSSRDTIHDELTEMFDHRYFELRLDADLAIARRSGRPIGCILIDIDQMDLVNTWFGRALGDDVLKNVGQAVIKTCRHEDVASRFEADTFAVLISDADTTQTAELSERLRLAVRSTTSIHQERAVEVTASIGFALSRFSVGSSIVIEAQEALSRAKIAGGDCVRAGRELVELRLAV